MRALLTIVVSLACVRAPADGPPTPEKENGPAHVLRAAANAAVMRRGAAAANGASAALGYAEVNRPAARNGVRAAQAARVV